jgi:hypothetical protein
MSLPIADPIRLQVTERFIAVLEGIVGGEDYWMTPAEVQSWSNPSIELSVYPTYQVYIEGGNAPENEMGGRFEQEVAVIVKVIDQDNTDLVKRLERSRRDIIKAVMADLSGGAGSLAELSSTIRVDADTIIFGLDGFGSLEQRFLVTLAGKFSD